jgi:hypothetical protein
MGISASKKILNECNKYFIMRNLINIVEDYGLPTPAELNAFKSVIAAKIKKLPADDNTAKTLKEIEELLQHVHAGGRMGMINGQLHEINDPAVMASQKRLAQYIASMEVSPDDRAELFSLWKADKLVNIDALLSKKNKTFADIFTQYGKNKAITELIDDVMSESALGQGKGEFGLNVLSKSVSKPGKLVGASPEEESVEGKGDLLIRYSGKWRKIEVKTTHGGGARFGDQEVRPAEGYDSQAADLNRFVMANKAVASQVFPKGVPSYGINLNKAIDFYQLAPQKVKDEFFNKVSAIITTIFGGKTADKAAVKKIMSAFKAGNKNDAIQMYAQTSFNFYMGKKDDEGVLAINLNTQSFIFYSSADDLTKENMRFNADTIYLTAKDVVRGAYPQMSVVPTTFGANAKAAAEKAAAKEKEKWAKTNPDLPVATRRTTDDELDKLYYDWSKDIAARRGITNKNKILEISAKIREIMMSGYSADPKGAIRKLIKFFPELAPPKATPAAPAPTARPAAPPPKQPVAAKPAPTVPNSPQQPVNSLDDQPDSTNNIGRQRR